MLKKSRLPLFPPDAARLEKEAELRAESVACILLVVPLMGLSLPVNKIRQRQCLADFPAMGIFIFLDCNCFATPSIYHAAVPEFVSREFFFKKNVNRILRISTGGAMLAC